MQIFIFKGNQPTEVHPLHVQEDDWIQAPSLRPITNCVKIQLAGDATARWSLVRRKSNTAAFYYMEMNAKASEMVASS
jgi:hypothetical protein